MLTFSKDKSNSPDGKTRVNRVQMIGKENNKIYVNLEKEGIINILESKQRSTPQYSNNNNQQYNQNEINYYKNTSSITPNKTTLSSGKKSMRPRSQQSSKEKKYSSPSPNSRIFKNSNKKQNTNTSQYKNFIKNRQSLDQINRRSYIGSGEKDRSQTPVSQNQQHSIDRLIRENIKKQKDKDLKEQEAAAYQKDQLSQRKLKNEVKNKEIRNRNLNQCIVQKQKKKLNIQGEDRVGQLVVDRLHEFEHKQMEMKSKSPMKVWEQMQREKNKDMPLKVEQKRNKKQLGLEIFDLRKELLLEQQQQQHNNFQVSIDQSNNQSTYRNNPNKVKVQNTNSNQVQDNNNNNNNYNDKDDNRVRQVRVKPSQQKKAQEDKEKVNSELQKLIVKQSKKRTKLEKQEKFQELIKHQKVMENLKSLNKQIGLQRKKMGNEPNSINTSKNPNENNSRKQQQQFKTVQDQFQMMNLHVQDFQPSLGGGDKSVSRTNLINQSKERESSIENRSKLQKVVSARRQTLGPPVQKQKMKQFLPNKQVIYSYISQGKQIPAGLIQKRAKSKGGKRPINKDQLIQMLLKKLQSQQQKSLLGDENSTNNSMYRFKKRKSSKIQRPATSINYNKSVQQNNNQLYLNSIDSPELRLKKSKKKSKQGGQGQRVKNFDNDFSNLVSKSLQNSPARSDNIKHENRSLYEAKKKANQQSMKNQDEQQQAYDDYGDEGEEDEEFYEVEGGEDQIILDDEMMINCIYNTAASIIQNQFKKYISNKKLKQKQQYNNKAKNYKQNNVQKEQKQVVNNNVNVFNKDIIAEEEKEKLKDSAILEHRILPSKEVKQQDQQQQKQMPQSQDNQQQQLSHYQQQLQKKTPKHTVSFGRSDDIQVISVGGDINSNFPSFYQQTNNNNQVQNQTQNSQSTNQHRETSPVADISPLGRGVNIFSYQNINESEYSENFMNLHSMNNNNNNIKEDIIKKQEYQQKQNAQYKDEIDSEQQEEDELKRVLNIDRKLKKALQSLVQHQKSGIGMESIKRQPKNQKPNLNTNFQNNQQKNQNQQQNIVQNKNEGKKFIGSSKDTIQNDIEEQKQEQIKQVQEQVLTQNKPSIEQLNKINNSLPVKDFQLSSPEIIQEKDTSFELLEKHMKKNEQEMTEKEIDISGISSLEIEDNNGQQQEDEYEDEDGGNFIPNYQDQRQQQQQQYQNNEDKYNNNPQQQQLQQQQNKNVSILNDDNQSEQNSSSLHHSFGGQTDKIICQSPINTNDENQEQAINRSNTLNNEESGIEEFKQDHSSRIDDSQLNIYAFQSEKGGQGYNGQNNNSILIDEDGGAGFNFDLGYTDDKKGGTKSQKSDNGQQERDKGKFSLKQKPLLRLMCGDEQYLRMQEEQDGISYDRELVSNQDFLGSGPSSNRLLQSENPYFLATNASIFERNPFKEFTSNKLNEILAGKNSKELLEMKEDAIKYQEKLEKGFINRLERKQELSPISSQRRKYELECWVTNERKSLQIQKKEKQIQNQPINVFDLEHERQEAARIIDLVNNKAKDIKVKLNQNKQKIIEEQKQHGLKQRYNNFFIEDIPEESYKSNIVVQQHEQLQLQQQQQQKQQQVFGKVSENIKVEELVYQDRVEEEEPVTFAVLDKSLSQKESISRLDLSEEMLGESKLQNNQCDKIVGGNNHNMPELYNMSKEIELGKDEVPTVLLEISFDDDEENFQFEKDTGKLTFPNQIIDTQNTLSQIKEPSLIEQFEKNLSDKATQKEKEVDEITRLIFESFLKDELSFKKSIPQRNKNSQQVSSFNLEIDQQQQQQQQQQEKQEVKEQKVALKQLQAVQLDMNDIYEEVSIESYNKSNGNEKYEETKEQSHNQQQDLANQVSAVIPTLEVIMKDVQRQVQQPLRTLGIDTTEEAIELYIEDIFTQIRSRKDLFMQAFATPIYKNPLEVLSNLQRPDYGELEATVDLSNSLSCILNVQLYLTLEKARDNIIQQAIQQIRQQNLAYSQTMKSGGGENQLTDDEIADLITESQHIHNKVIFDCVNEALNSVRPYSNNGEPMPWSNKPKKNLIFLMEDPENINNILNKVKTRVMRLQGTKAGALPPKYPDQNQYSNQQMEAIIQMDEEMFSQQREKCLAQMLARDLIEGEEKWLDYEMEEAQVKIDLSDIVLEQLVGEVCEILKDIQDKRDQMNQ